MRKRKQTPAKNDENSTNRLIGMAYKEAEERILNGTASSQLIVTLLNMASAKTKLEVERLKSDLRVAEARIKQLESQTNGEELYMKAIEAFKKYSGSEEEDEWDEDEEY